MLKIKNLKVAIDGKPILSGLDLKVKAGEVHAIMGLNGTGKSTLLKAIAGAPETEVSGMMRFEGEDLLEQSPAERATAGVFMSFQNPVEIPGVNTIYFLRTALNEQRKARGKAPITSVAFMKKLENVMATLGVSKEILQRSVNVGFSGGEKKRSELLQMMMLKPSLMLLDEIDSGLDIDALGAVAEGINAMRSKKRAIIMVTHYSRLLEYVKPDVVHVLSEGRIAHSGDASLAMILEAKGYDHVLHP